MTMEKKKGLLNYLLGLPEGAQVRFDPEDKTLLSSRLVDDKGNTNLFRIIIDKNAPELTQRIYANDYRNNY